MDDTSEIIGEYEPEYDTLSETSEIVGEYEPEFVIPGIPEHDNDEFHDFGKIKMLNFTIMLLE